MTERVRPSSPMHRPGTALESERLDARASGVRDEARAACVGQTELLRRPELLDRLAADASPTALADPVGLRLEPELGPDAQERLDERGLLVGRVAGRGRDAEALLAARDRRTVNRQRDSASRGRTS